MNEFELIAHRPPTFRPTPRWWPVLAMIAPWSIWESRIDGVVFKTDAVVEDVHFTRQTEPEKVGHKALARVLSDFAAAAAKPRAALVTLGLPRAHDVDWVEGVYRGLRATDVVGVAIVGGETTTNPDRNLISIAAIGTVARDWVVRRRGAQPGDAIFVSGTLGGSEAAHHLDFIPRLDEAAWLVERFEVHAMIHVSDGLAGDLRHLLTASGVGAELWPPPSAGKHG